MKLCTLKIVVLVSVGIAGFDARAGMIFTEIPTLGGPGSSANAVNNAGTVVGLAWLGAGPTLVFHGFSYSNGVITDLGTLGGEQSEYLCSDAADINDAGVVVGTSEISTNSELKHAYRWRNGVIEDLGDIWGYGSGAFGINSAGTIVGTACRPDGVSRAFRFSGDGPMEELPGTLGTGQHTWAKDINNHGVIVGSAHVDITNQWAMHACMWVSNQLIDLGTLGGGEPMDQSGAEAINDSDVVVGSAKIWFTKLDFAWRAFRWTWAGGMENLGVLAGFSNSFAYDINSQGVIVGSVSSPYHAALWLNGQWFDLHERYFPSWDDSWAYGINDRGWIVGRGIYTLLGQPTERGWVLIPVPPAPGGPVITQAVMTAAGFVMRGTNGWPLAEYQVLYSTNVAQPMTNWTAIATNVFDLDGAFACTNAIPDSPPQAFFRLRTQAGD